MNQDSNRVAETKQKIKKAFLSLYKEKRIEKISIKEITDKAGVNRGTFYAYYLDIYDLLEQIEMEVMDGLKIEIQPIISALLSGTKLSPDVLPFNFFQQNKEILDLFFGDTADANMIRRLKKMAQGIAISNLHLKVDDSDEGKKLQYVLEYISAGQIALITYWFKNGMALTMPELGILVEEVNTQGALTYLIKHRASK